MILGIAAFGRGSELRRDAWHAIGRAQLAALHVVGGALGGTACMAAVWFLFAPVRLLAGQKVQIAFALAVAAAAAARDLGWLKWTGSSHQVPKAWLRRYGPRQAFIAYGAVLGMGIFTFGSASLIFVVTALAGLSPLVTVAAAMGGAYGVGRAAVVAVGMLSPQVASRWLYRGRHAVSRVHRTSAVACVASGAVVILAQF